MRQKKDLIKNSLGALRSLGTVALDESIADGDVRSALFDQVPRETMAGYVEDVAEWITELSSHNSREC